MAGNPTTGKGTKAGPPPARAAAIQDEVRRDIARALVREVRDAALRRCDRELLPTATSAVSKRWRASGVNAHDPSASVVFPDAVDATMQALLHAIDEGLLRVKFLGPDGAEVDLTGGEGKLAEKYMEGDASWLARHSGERWVDYASLVAKAKKG